MKRIALLLLLTITSVNAGWSDFLSNIGKKEQVAKEIIKQQVQNKGPLQNQLDELLRYNGKVCTPSVYFLDIVKTDWNYSYRQTSSTEYTNYQKLDNDNYYTYKTNLGGDSESDGVYIIYTLENTSDTPIDAKVKITAHYSSKMGWFSTSYSPNRVVNLTIPPGKTNYREYFDKGISSMEKAVYHNSNVEFMRLDTSDDATYNNANTLIGYSRYLKTSGCHYHISQAQSKIKQLFSKQKFKRAVNLPTPKERILALKKYQKLFDTSEAKQAIYFNERVIYLSDKTKDYNSVYWEQGNPLLTTFKSDFNTNEIAYLPLPLVLAVDNYVKTSQNKTKTINDFVAKQLPAKPSKSDFGTKPNKQDYPIEPTFTKGEFETSKNFNMRKIKETQSWKAQKTKIDKTNKTAYNNYLKQQNNDYQQALASYQKTKAQTIQDNKQDKLAHEKQQFKANQDAQNNKQKYYWQAALKTIGNKDLKFTKLDYDADKEQFDYIIKGSEIDMICFGKEKLAYQLQKQKHLNKSCKVTKNAFILK